MVWVFGIVSFFFNLYMIVAMSCSALAVLKKMPHRFIYRILVATIAFGKRAVICFENAVIRFRPGTIIMYRN